MKVETLTKNIEKGSQKVTVYLETYGCQMNEHDSSRMMGVLLAEGYTMTDEVDEANLVLVNTCSVRFNPENKVYSHLGRLRKKRNKGAEFIVGVGGCVAQQEGEAILKRNKVVDMVFGPDNLFKLPEMIERVNQGERVLMTKWQPHEQRVQNFIPEEWVENAKTYAAMITRMDQGIGKIMESLKKAGIDEHTIVFFTSDNGAAESSQKWGIFESNAPLRGVKRDPYEGGIRVPMIVRYPGTIPAGENDLTWYFADVMPTLSDLTGAKVPGAVDGISILPTLLGRPQDPGNRTLYWEFYEKAGWRAVRFGNWKAIQHNMNMKEHQPVELYNLETDIRESTNLAASHPELVQKAEELFEKLHTPSTHYIWKNNDSNEPAKK